MVAGLFNQSKTGKFTQLTKEERREMCKKRFSDYSSKPASKGPVKLNRGGRGNKPNKQDNKEVSMLTELSFVFLDQCLIYTFFRWLNEKTHY